MTLLRRCYMPKAGLGDAVEVWVSENGYATNLGRDEASQAASLESTVRAVHAWSGELGITDYRYFNLRDNNSDGTDLFAAVGVLRDDYSRKPAFDVLRGLMAEVGTPVRPLSTTTRRARLSVRVRRRGRHVVVRGRVLGPARCTGAVRVAIGARVRRPRLRPDCRFRTRARVARRLVRVVVRRGSLVVRRRV
jgi:hypothetical protein